MHRERSGKDSTFIPTSFPPSSKPVAGHGCSTSLFRLHGRRYRWFVFWLVPLEQNAKYARPLTLSSHTPTTSPPPFGPLPSHFAARCEASLCSSYPHKSTPSTLYSMSLDPQDGAEQRGRVLTLTAALPFYLT